ncbi:speckle-type POZ protein-like [Microplitis mediator]|uniref:speckle-type POZ protein-like n=1 Tax=Microplitis mediator TaxID=375433 RepID=UPI002553721F|nr:speckle-type POZ protein-like [Microplitis mediator]
MPLQKIERNVHTAYDTWVLKNMSEKFAKVNPEPMYDDSVKAIHYFSKKFEDNDIKWYVKLKFADNELRGGFFIEFDAVKQFEPKNHVTCNFYLVDADKNKFFIGRKNRKFNSTYYYFPLTSSCIFSKISKLPNTIDKLLPNDTMTLKIELITYLDDNPIFPLEDADYNIEPVVNLVDILKLYPFQNGGDVKIYVQGIEFSVHKTLLETRCPKTYEIVARHQQMSDGNDNQLVLTDIKPEIFQRVLEFIYTGKVEDLDDHAESLLEAASQYELIGLKYMCELSLVNNYLTYENSKEVKELARRCSATSLLFNVNKLRYDESYAQMDFSCTPSGTLICTTLSGKKEVYKNCFKNGIPMGINIVPE